MPVTAFNGSLFFSLRLAHAFLQTVVDTRSVGDDQRRTVVSLGFAQSLQRLSLVSTHSNLGNINITVSRSHQAEVLLADTLAGSGKLGDGAERSSLGRLATGVGVNFGIEDEDIDVLAGSDNVVETAVTDVVRSTVATDNPLRTFNEEGLQTVDGSASRAFVLGSFNHRDDLVGQFFRLLGVVLVVNPCLECFLVVGRSSVVGDSIFHSLLDAGTHLFVGQFHTETELAEVLEQRVSPSRTMSLFVRSIRSRRN